MKVCERCGEEIYMKDGENRCDDCEFIATGSIRKPKQKKAKLSRKDREQVMRDLGLVKVRGAMGGVYWE